jgi:voltage-gated potassium channel
MAPRIKTVAELLEGENRPHLKRARVDEIIVRGEHVGSLLASAVNAPGLPKVFSNIMTMGDTNKLRRFLIPRTFVGKTFKDLAIHFSQQQAILIGLLREKKAMKLEDLLSDNTSIIDTFIKEKIRESKREFYYEQDEANVLVNPGEDCVISSEDFAVVISKPAPKKT